jgi:hypothetical protein
LETDSADDDDDLDDAIGPDDEGRTPEPPGALNKNKPKRVKRKLFMAVMAFLMIGQYGDDVSERQNI